jgi:hypothetical protein
LPTLLGEDRFAVGEYSVPRQVDSKATAVKKGRNWVITASGGVMIQPWEMIEKASPSEKVASARAQAVQTRKNSWWWN